MQSPLPAASVETFLLKKIVVSFLLSDVFGHVDFDTSWDNYGFIRRSFGSRSWQLRKQVKKIPKC